MPGRFNTSKIQAEECFLALLTFCTDFISEGSPQLMNARLWFFFFFCSFELFISKMIIVTKDAGLFAVLKPGVH